MVRDKKTGSGCVTDNGSTTRRWCDKERPADQDHQSLSPVGQRKPESGYRAQENIRRLNAATITQAYKDLCNDDRKDPEYEWDKIIAWTETPFFEEVCDVAGMEDVDLVRQSFKEIRAMPLRIRRELIRKRRREASVYQ